MNEADTHYATRRTWAPYGGAGAQTDRKTLNGQLCPLEDRMTEHQLEKRAVKIEARRAVAQQLGLEIAKAQGLARITLSVLQRGLFGRLKWLLFGR